MILKLCQGWSCGTYDHGSRGGWKSGGSGFGGGVYLGAGGFGDDESTTNDTLRILRERAWLADLGTDGSLDGCALFDTPAADGWCGNCFGRSLFGNIAGFGSQRCKASGSWHGRCGYRCY